MPVIKLPSDNVGNIVAVIKSEADLNVFPSGLLAIMV